MKRNRIKVGVFAIVLLLLAMLFSGCGSETEILHFEQSHLKESSSKDHYAYGTLTDEEKEALGIKKKDNIMNLDEFNGYISELIDEIHDYQGAIEWLKEDL